MKNLSKTAKTIALIVTEQNQNLDVFDTFVKNFENHKELSFTYISLGTTDSENPYTENAPHKENQKNSQSSISEAIQTIKRIDPAVLILPNPILDTFQRLLYQIKLDSDFNAIQIVGLTDEPLHLWKNEGIWIKPDRILHGKQSAKEQEAILLDLIVLHTALLNQSTFSIAIELISSSVVSNLDLHNDFAQDLLLKLNLDDMSIDEIRSGVYEMVANAMEWGNHWNKELLTRVRYEINEQKIKIIVTDEGDGFNTISYLDTKYKGIEHQEERIESGKRLGGFGITIAKKYFDKISYNQAGNSVQLERSRTRRNSNQAEYAALATP